MMAPYLIRISSQKGGVGKTTIAVNLAVALQIEGYKVLLIDGDTVNPSIGFHLGLEDVNIGLKELVTGKANLMKVRAVHVPTGVHVVPGVLTQKEYMPTEDMLKKLNGIISKTSYNFAIMDTMPGYTIERIGSYYNEALLISTPEMASVANVIRLATWFDKEHLKHSLVLNKMKNKRYELHQKEIEEMYEGKIVAKLPDDETVPISIEEHIPAYIYNKRTPFSKAMRELAHFYGARSEATSETEKRSVWSRLFRRR
jgi:MinD-like ATPase involved in chromosome partitioning or flagellar assembly